MLIYLDNQKFRIAHNKSLQSEQVFFLKISLIKEIHV